jgi:membrane associated rhomboid family serine protease
MARGPATTFGFPPFTRAVKTLIIANVAVYLVMMLSRLTIPVAADFAEFYLYLRPVAVVHGQIWQLVTYSFLHDPHSVLHLLFNMLGLWMFGSQFEMDFGKRRFYEFYFWCVIGAALTTIAVGAFGLIAYEHVPFALFRIMGQVWLSSTIGASGGVYGLLIAFGILNGDREVFIFPFPIAIKARYIVAIWLFIAFVSAFEGANGVAEFAHLGGALFGWLYLRFIPRYGLQTAASEGMFGIRNRYYKWKRRQAAKKFEVYMRKSKRDEYFDENGNYRGPSLDKKDDDSKWIN